MSCKGLLFIKLAIEETLRSNGGAKDCWRRSLKLYCHSRAIQGRSKSHQTKPRRTVNNQHRQAEDIGCVLRPEDEDTIHCSLPPSNTGSGRPQPNEHPVRPSSSSS
jgi:hypothetical protein